MPVFNKMVYNGTEYILGGGGNIGEPLNLTVTTSGLDATITWEDNEIGTIPPTTFQKSELVRKIGSAPTSPSDGVLVVTETVKDTYKVSGYVDSGLTDGTTYYYRVFSYSDLGGISYCDAVSVTPSLGWAIDSDTITYLKLAGDTSDESNNYSYTLGANGEFVSDQANVSVLHATYDNGYLESTTNGPSLNTGDAYTISCWVKGISNTTWSAFRYREAPTWATQSGISLYSFVQNGTNRGYVVYYNGTSPVLDEILFTGDYSSWKLVTAVLKSGASKIYINGAVVSTSSTTWSSVNINPGTTIKVGADLATATRNPNGYYSELFFTKGEKTAQEIADYFDQTKAKYGIS